MWTIVKLAKMYPFIMPVRYYYIYAYYLMCIIKEYRRIFYFNMNIWIFSYIHFTWVWVIVMVFNATFNNISVGS